MDVRNDIALGGDLVISPAWSTGEDYTRQQWFNGFRNQSFAENNRTRVFSHIQGGFYIFRKSVFDDVGGFHLPHNHMDVEFSYYLESLNYKLGKIPEVISLSAKTLPGIETYMNENIAAIHPITNLTKQSKYLKNLFNGDDIFFDNLLGELCTDFSIDSFSRTIFVILSRSELIYKNKNILAIVNSKDLECVFKRHKKMFSDFEVIIDEFIDFADIKNFQNNDIFLIENIDIKRLSVLLKLIKNNRLYKKTFIISGECLELSKVEHSVSELGFKYVIDPLNLGLYSKTVNYFTRLIIRIDII
jgi:hypothetical protein